MPFFKFHFVEASRMAGVSRRMADRLQETIGCPREHIVFELIHSSVVEDVTIKSGNDWPYVEEIILNGLRRYNTKLRKSFMNV